MNDNDMNHGWRAYASERFDRLNRQDAEARERREDMLWRMGATALTFLILAVLAIALLFA